MYMKNGLMILDKFQEDVDFRHEFPLISKLDLEDT